MHKLRISPEEFPVSGGVNASELTKSTQSPVLNDIELLLREAVQNTQDQRISDQIPVFFHIQIKKLVRHQVDYLREVLHNTQNREFLPVGEIEFNDTYMIYFSDKNTKGLNGPTSARESSRDGNFVNFFLKIGRNAESDSDAGGSFGHGRAVFFNNSKNSTAFAYSRFQNQGVESTRFFGMTLGDNFDSAGLNYTGKWFWGKSRELIAAPFENAEADEIAQLLGMKSAIQESCGTVLAILAPKFINSDQNARHYAKALRYYAEKNLWPLLLRTGQNDQMFELSIQIEDETPEIIDVTSESSVSHKYVELYKRHQLSKEVDNGGSLQLMKKIVSPKDEERTLPRGASLGTLNWLRVMSFESFKEEEIDIPDHELSGLPLTMPPLSGIALFRKPKIVVEYVTFQSQENDLKIIGFFESSPNANYFFRLSEKDTHDSWDVSRMQKALGSVQANPVRKVLESIKDLYGSFSLPSLTSEVASWVPQGMLEFGSLLSFAGSGVGRPGPGRRKSPGRTGSSSSPISIIPDMSVKLEEFSTDRVCGIFKFKISRNQKLAEGKVYRISFEPRVAIEDGFENEESEALNESDPKIEELVLDGLSLGSKSSFISDDKITNHEVTLRISTPKNLRIACFHKATYINLNEVIS